MTDYTLMQLIIWIEQSALRCFYSFEGLYIKPRFMTPARKEIREQYNQDSKDLVALAQALYKLQLPYKTHRK